MLGISGVIGMPNFFGTKIWEHLNDNDSNIVAAAAGCQSSNSLVESHWKVMVHMARAYLTEKQMPWLFWFYVIVHSARMMNAIPGKFGGMLASPFLLVHGSGHNEQTWFPLFSICYFHHEKDGNIPHSHTANPTQWMALLLVIHPRQMHSRCTTHGLNAIMSPTLIVWTRITSLLQFILLSSMTVGSFVLCFTTRMCQLKSFILWVHGSNAWTLT
jgi:hypothetical protein